MAKNRLSKEDWIAAGFRALSSRGAPSLKAEALARDLGTTKGSFYWHFADVPAFHNAMLDLWEARAFQDIAEEMDQIDNPVKRLRALGAAAAQGTPEEFGGDNAEPAIRAWAQENTSVAQAVTRVDTRRMDYVASILKDIGVTNPEITRLIYGAYVGMSELSARDAQDNGQAMGTLVDLVLALYEDA